jgi:hypothetical protein
MIRRGIGKTALAQRLRTVAEQRGLPHLDGRAPAGPFAVPLRPFIQVLMGAIRDALRTPFEYISRLVGSSPRSAIWATRASRLSTKIVCMA